MRSPDPRLTWVVPVVPPMTHIPEMGGPTLGSREIHKTPLAALFPALEQIEKNTTSSPALQATMAELRGSQQAMVSLIGSTQRMRGAVTRDASHLVAALGDVRVAQVLARKEELSERYGEGRLWAEAIRRVRP